jgi:galactokinase
MEIWMREVGEKAENAFKKAFGAAPQVLAVAPGRLELLGNHTDYNQGLILGLAINRYIAIAARKTAKKEISIYSSAFNQTVSFDIEALDKNPKFAWTNYCKGIF